MPHLNNSTPNDTLLPPAPPKAGLALPVALCCLFAIQAFFLGQLSPWPLLWGLLLLFGAAVMVPLLKESRNLDLRSWLWFIPLVVVLTKILFFPGPPWDDVRWLTQIGQGMVGLFREGLLFRAASLSQAAGEVSLSAALFLLLGVLFWGPVTLAMRGALRLRSWGWPVFTTLLLLVWLEPLPTSSFFFLPLVLLAATVFLLAIHLQRRERWESRRLAHDRRDLRRALRWSLLIALPLLLLVVPWAVARFSYAQLTLPSLPAFAWSSQEAAAGGASGFPSIRPTGPLPDRDVPLYHLPPLDMPESLTRWAVVASTVILLGAAALMGYFLLRMGKGFTVAYMVATGAFLVLSLWLLPPVLGPIMGRFFALLLEVWRGIRTAFGLANPTAAPSVAAATLTATTGASGGVDSLGQFLASLLTLISRYAVWATILGAFVFLLAAFFVWRSIARTRLLRAEKRKRLAANEPSQGLLRGGIFALYFRLLALLARMGWTRQPMETPYEFAQRASPALPWLEQPVRGITEAFVLARYGGQESEPAQEEQLGEELEQATHGAPNTPGE